MQLIVTDGVVWCLCLSVIMSPAKMAEPTEPFETWIRVGPRNHVLDWGQNPHM